MTAVVDGNARVRVSSVLNRDTRQFGKKYLFDGEEDTCWNSDQGLPQWIHVNLDTGCDIAEIQIKFQGGFAGKDCCLEAHTDEEIKKIMDFYPEDVNSLQSFKLPEPLKMSSFRIVFNSSTDFFGRITIYQLSVLGSKS
ncbi:nuclear receptor 2C2-associated protein-like [Pecten maximus]|uniref:nuclear receptor 2C2-associated protein-like n=1 Tax=Pecten maximus TaxID=6579 RepID=UPI001458AC34|nr:nuclear receptor 2C2-associated protein-like [Pecten maximus]